MLLGAVVLGGAVRQPAMRRRALSSLEATLPSMTSSPISTRKSADQVLVLDDVQVHGRGVGLAERLGEPGDLGGAERACGVHDREQLVLHVGRDALDRVQRATERLAAAHGLADEALRGRRSTLPSSTERQERGLVVGAARRVGQDVAQVGVGVDELAHREQLVADPRTLGAGRADQRLDAELLEHAGQVAGAGPALLDGLLDQVERRVADLAAEHVAGQACLGLALHGAVGEDPPQRRLGPQHAGHREQLVAQRRGVLERAGADLRRQLGAGLR